MTLQDLGEPGPLAADQFSLGSAATVTGVQWFGSFGNSLSPFITPIAFEVTIYPDSSGFPSGPALYDATVNADVVDIGVRFNIVQVGYNLSADLPGGPALAAGTTYWLSIAGPGNFSWDWAAGTAGDTVAIEVGGGWHLINVDQGNLAFSIEGTTTTPEPATLPLVICSAWCFFGVRKFKR